MDNTEKYTDSLCWHCKRCLPGRECEWADDFIPVKGWDARKDIKKANGGEFESYFVFNCPKFKKG